MTQIKGEFSFNILCAIKVSDTYRVLQEVPYSEHDRVSLPVVNPINHVTNLQLSNIARTGSKRFNRQSVKLICILRELKKSARIVSRRSSIIVETLARCFKEDYPKQFDVDVDDNNNLSVSY